MKPIFIFTICLIIMGLCGCSTISTKLLHKQDLYLHCYVSDSLGVEKSVFGRNEPIYYGFILRNNTKHPIKYTRVDFSSAMFDIADNEEDSNRITFSSGTFPPGMWKEHILNPGDELSQFQGFPPPKFLKAGRCYTIFTFRLYFGHRYDKLFNSDIVKVRFIITKE